MCTMQSAYDKQKVLLKNNSGQRDEAAILKMFFKQKLSDTETQSTTMLAALWG